MRTLSPLFYAEARVPAGARLALPDEHEERAAFDAEAPFTFSDEP